MAKRKRQTSFPAGYNPFDLCQLGQNIPCYLGLPQMSSGQCHQDIRLAEVAATLGREKK